MVDKQVFDHSLRESGKKFISSLKASNRYSEGYLASLETSVAMAALYAKEQGWPGVREITTSHIEDYLAYLQERTRWFGERTYAERRKLSKSHINVQYRRLNRFFNWLVEHEYAGSNPFHLIKPPSLDEKTVPVVAEDQMRDLLTLADPALARTLDKIKNLHHYLHSADAISLSPDLAVKPAVGRADGKSGSGWNSAEAHAAPAWASPLWRTTDLGIRLSAVHAGLTCEELSGLPSLVIDSSIPFCSQECV